MNGLICYETVSAAVREAYENGIGVYEMAVAYELGQAVSERKKGLRRRRKLLDKLDEDTQGLFEAAVSTYRNACGGCAPREAARGILDSYLRFGMDVGRAKAYASMPDFAMSC